MIKSNIEELVLRIEELKIARAVSNEELSAYYNFDLDALVLTLRKRLATYRGKEPLVVRWPATWWQHFKQHWFPRWALRRWPVQMETRRYWAAIALPAVEIPLNMRANSYFFWQDDTNG